MYDTLGKWLIIDLFEDIYILMSVEYLRISNENYVS